MGWGWDEKIKQKIQNLVINQKDFMAETISTQRLTNVVLLVRSVIQKVRSKETNLTLLKVVVYHTLPAWHSFRRLEVSLENETNS